MKKEVGSEVERKLSVTIAIGNMTKDAIQKHSGPMFTEPGMPKTITHEASPDGNVTIPNSKIEPASSDDEIDSDKDHLQPFDMPTALPRTNAKSNRNRRSSFDRSGNMKAFFEVPKSPLDADFHVGCNDDLLSSQSSPSEASLTSNQK